jgi:DNA-binding response OmpR family regulator
VSTILIVEDNEDLLDDLLLNLRHAGMDVHGVGDAQQLDAYLVSHMPAVLVLDLGLPDEDGLSVVQRIKQSHPKMGVIMVTARVSLDDKLLGYQLGADNYLPKPVNYQELIMIIGSLLRRLAETNSPALVSMTATDACWLLDKRKMTISAPIIPNSLDAVASLTLTWTEVCMLEVFSCSDAGSADKQALLKVLGGDADDDYYQLHRLEAAISRLRKKLESLSSDKETLIKVQRAKGYQFMQPLMVV